MIALRLGAGTAAWVLLMSISAEQVPAPLERLAARARAAVAYPVAVEQVPDRGPNLWASFQPPHPRSILRDPEQNLRVKVSQGYTFFPNAGSFPITVFINLDRTSTDEIPAITAHELAHVILVARGFPFPVLAEPEDRQSQEILHFVGNLALDVAVHATLAREGFRQDASQRGQLELFINTLERGYESYTSMFTGANSKRVFVAALACNLLSAVGTASDQRRLFSLLPGDVRSLTETFRRTLSKTPPLTAEQFQASVRQLTAATGASKPVIEFVRWKPPQ
jgi:hypothetical protein